MLLVVRYLSWSREEVGPSARRCVLESPFLRACVVASGLLSRRGTILGRGWVLFRRRLQHIVGLGSLTIAPLGYVNLKSMIMIFQRGMTEEESEKADNKEKTDGPKQALFFDITNICGLLGNEELGPAFECR
ncbi:unnamed protein product [Prunus armeniaca]|uniref:Uncharacterized protein n=1 Tax=Prunus armeniaca TaxID=36596 RepID=A0A6J5TJ80_PRUAR|nr:unnamed protein product [Prunus armeniaca]